MRTRSKPGREPVKARRHKAAPPKHRNRQKAVRRRSLASTRQTEFARVIRERDELLEQQTATSEVLKVISSSTFELETVLETLCASAARLCETEMVAITRLLGGKHFQVANFGYPPGFSAYTKTLRLSKGRGSLTGRVLLEKDAVHIPDVLADPEYEMHEAQDMGGFRTMLGVPLLREGNPIGVIILLRRTMQPFNARQIELVKTFADQAVIAIENVRLFEAEQQRTRELSELLEQQTATSEVLQVISSSPGDLQPVFATMLENAARICGANFGNIYRWDGDALHLIATHNTPPALAEARRRSPTRPAQSPLVDRVVVTKTVAHIPDLAAEPTYIKQRIPSLVAAVELGGIRTLLIVPMLKENELLGVFSLYRQEVRPFTDKQIALLTNFAAQAVIAIENARLLKELRERTGQLGAVAGGGQTEPTTRTAGRRAGRRNRANG
jgi:GAF domain-containing protein